MITHLPEKTTSHLACKRRRQGRLSGDFFCSWRECWFVETPNRSTLIVNALDRFEDGSTWVAQALFHSLKMGLKKWLIRQGNLEWWRYVQIRYADSFFS